MAAGLGLSNGPGNLGLGREELGIQRRAAPRCTDSIGFLLAALSLAVADPFTPA